MKRLFSSVLVKETDARFAWFRSPEGPSDNVETQTTPVAPDISVSLEDEGAAINGSLEAMQAEEGNNEELDAILDTDESVEGLKKYENKSPEDQEADMIFLKNIIEGDWNGPPVTISVITLKSGEDCYLIEGSIRNSIKESGGGKVLWKNEKFALIPATEEFFASRGKYNEGMFSPKSQNPQDRGFIVSMSTDEDGNDIMDICPDFRIPKNSQSNGRTENKIMDMTEEYDRRLSLDEKINGLLKDVELAKKGKVNIDDILASPSSNKNEISKVFDVSDTAYFISATQNNNTVKLLAKAPDEKDRNGVKNSKKLKDLRKNSSYKDDTAYIKNVEFNAESWRNRFVEAANTHNEEMDKTIIASYEGLKGLDFKGASKEVQLLASNMLNARQKELYAKKSSSD